MKSIDASSPSANPATLGGRRVLVCTTFREFNGNANDAIQRLFLRSLRAQTYQDYTLIVTTFGERNIEKALLEEGISSYEIHAGEAGKYRFSSTQVVQNAVAAVKGPGTAVIVWTTCDDIFDPRFFEEALATLTPRAACTSLPHIMYRTMADYDADRPYLKCWGGIDTICFDADVFLQPEVQEALRRYPNKGWGYFEYFLSGIGRVFCENMYNIAPPLIDRIDNDRKANNETRAYFNLVTSHNKGTYEAFARDYGLRGDVYASVLAYKLPPAKRVARSLFFLHIARIRVQVVFWKAMNAFLPRGLKALGKRLFLAS
jgi:hypothetical protein